MSNVRLQDIKSKGTADLINETASTLKLPNNGVVRELLRQLNINGGTNELVRIVILQFLNRATVNLANGYKVVLMNIVTMHPDIILQDNVPIENCGTTLKASFSSVLLNNCRNIKIQVKETNKDELDQLPL